MILEHAPASAWSPHAGRRHWQWIAILALSILLHLAFLDLLPRWTVAPDAVDEAPLRARLVPLPVPIEAKPDVPVPAPTRATRPRDEAARPRRPAPPPAFVPEALVPSIASVEVGPPEAKPLPAPVAPSSQETLTPPSVNPPTTPAPETRAPRSARLVYKVVAVDEKNFQAIHYYGVGTIDWAVDATRYRADLTAAVDFLLFKANVLASHSEGSVTTSGLAPDRYTETPRKRPMQATNFNRDDRRSITFSASAASFPLPSGAQDRLSVIFQIGALLQGDPGLAERGQIEVPVAGIRDLETWAFDVQGVESIAIGEGPRLVVHLKRRPRPDSKDRTIDVWLTQAEGLPARVVYTDPDGSTIALTLDRMDTSTSDE